MIPAIFWVPGPWLGRLAISARPRGGDWLEDDVRGWHRAAIDAVVSLLTPEEEEDLDLRGEGPLASAQGIRFVSFPIVDRSVPESLADTLTLLGDLRKALEAGKTVAVHCRQGIGRSALIAAGLLVAAGIEPLAALRTVDAARGMSVPETPEQLAWIRTALADRLTLVRG